MKGRSTRNGKTMESPGGRTRCGSRSPLASVRAFIPSVNAVRHGGRWTSRTCVRRLHHSRRWRPGTGLVIEGDIEAQARRAFENLKAVCEAAGGSLDRIVRAGLFLTRLARQNHEHQPLQAIDVHLVAVLVVVQRHQAVDDDLTLQRRQDSLALELQQVSAAAGGNALQLFGGEHAQRPRRQVRARPFAAGP